MVGKAYDLVLWLLPKVERFPRPYRFSVGDRMVGAGLDLLLGLVEAAYSGEKGRYLEGAVMRTNALRYLPRLSKPRLIPAAPFRDRVAHHALTRVLEPLFEKRFSKGARLDCPRRPRRHLAAARADIRAMRISEMECGLNCAGVPGTTMRGTSGRRTATATNLTTGTTTSGCGASGMWSAGGMRRRGRSPGGHGRRGCAFLHFRTVLQTGSRSPVEHKTRPGLVVAFGRSPAGADRPQEKHSGVSRAVAR